MRVINKAGIYCDANIVSGVANIASGVANIVSGVADSNGGLE